jgi:hypothetical protein
MRIPTTLLSNAAILSAAVFAFQSGVCAQVLQRTAPPPITTMVSGKHTTFDPTKDGFKFVNDFQNDVVPSVDVRTGGLCGGMSYTALDYFNAHAPIPQQDFRPANRTSLQSYLYNREVTSLASNLDKWAEVGLNPGGARNSEFFNWGLQATNGGRIQELKSYIDRGVPVPLGLQGDGGTGNHQVVAIGYDMGRYQGDLGAYETDFKIFIYDPNHPNQTMTLVPDPSRQLYVYQGGGSGETWRTYFVDAKYSAQQPPNVPGISYPSDGLAHQLVLIFHTGADDMRGGNDNLNLTVNLFDGTQQNYPNINLSGRWLANYTENAQVFLSRPVAASQIRNIVLTDTFGGGIGGDNWDMGSLNVRAIGGGLPNPDMIKSNVPAFRFTGSDKQLTIAMNNAPAAAPGQVTTLNLVFQTGSDDLRGGNDNLNIITQFTDGHTQSDTNVNQGANWANNSTHTVSVTLNKPVPTNQIRSIILVTTSSGGMGGDNWNMNSVQVTAVGNGVNKVVSTSGFKRFTGTDKQLTLTVNP